MVVIDATTLLLFLQPGTPGPTDAAGEPRRHARERVEYLIERLDRKPRETASPHSGGSPSAPPPTPRPPPVSQGRAGRAGQGTRRARPGDRAPCARGPSKGAGGRGAARMGSAGVADGEVLLTTITVHGGNRATPRPRTSPERGSSGVRRSGVPRRPYPWTRGFSSFALDLRRDFAPLWHLPAPPCYDQPPRTVTHSNYDSRRQASVEREGEVRQPLHAVWGVGFPRLLHMRISSASCGMRGPINGPTVPSRAPTEHSQTFPHQRDSSCGSERHSDPAQAASGRLPATSPAFMDGRSCVPLESPAP